MSSFWSSAHQGDTDRLVELLSQGQDVDEYCPAGVSAYRPTALAYAVWGNQPDAVGLLLERGANPNRSDGDQNYYPLHWASYHRDHADCAQLLVEAGADLGVRTQKGYTPLQLAMGQNDLVSRKPGVIAVLEEAARNPFPPWVPPCRPAHASTRTPPPPARRATAAAPLTPPQQRPQPRPQVVTGRGLQLLGRWGGQGSIFAPEQLPSARRLCEAP